MFVMHFDFDYTMYQFVRVLFVCSAIIFATGAAEIKSRFSTINAASKSEPEKQNTESFKASNGAAGVASVAAVASRNGRISSMSGFKFYPPIDESMISTDNKGTFIIKETDGKMPMPLIISREEDGVSGTIKIFPGSVSVTSLSKSDSPADFKPWPAPMLPPMMNDIFFPPFPIFRTSIPEPWIPKDMFKEPLPRQDMNRNNWMYNFNPFWNFW